MALTGKLETEVKIKAPADKFHEMFCARPHHITHASNDNIHGVDLHEGDFGQVGSVIEWTYVHDGKKKVAKEVVEHVDEEKKEITFKVIGGDLMEEYKSFKLAIKLIPDGEGSIVHWTLEYEKLSEEVAHPETLLDFCVEVSKDIDSHLLA